MTKKIVIAAISISRLVRAGFVFAREEACSASCPIPRRCRCRRMSAIKLARLIEAADQRQHRGIGWPWR